MPKAVFSCSEQQEEMHMRFDKALNRRRLLGIGMMALLATPLTAQESNINGVYEAQGRNPDGSSYTGQAVITESGSSVQVNWTVGQQTYAGSGHREGQVVVVNWGQPAPVIYVVMSNGDLYGTWANGTALERLVHQ
jgi:hypothetical protein